MSWWSPFTDAVEAGWGAATNVAGDIVGAVVEIVKDGGSKLKIRIDELTDRELTKMIDDIENGVIDATDDLRMALLREQDERSTPGGREERSVAGATSGWSLNNPAVVIGGGLVLARLLGK